MATVQVGADDELVNDLRAAETSYLVSADAAEQLKVLALEFDGPSLVQRAIDKGLDPDYFGYPRVASNAITVAADGGPVCHRTLTVVTVTLASEFLVENQSPLMPMVYLLSGEAALHAGVGRRLKTCIRELMDATFTVPWSPPTEDPSSGAAAMREIVAVRPNKTLRLVGDFFMLHHFMDLTGGCDVWRCPSGWPCTILMVLSHPSWSLGRPRTVRMLQQVPGGVEFVAVVCATDAGVDSDRWRCRRAMPRLQQPHYIRGA
eukprot:TRINITY_DN4860_c0_g2_i1.p2 TRINITY_DN4860_c0_g2~~TRINITY_DN4860_c0_g2_i1.p2  ORF type:complete len:261 (-),score=51.20 TRINITY_DN4860_c0_g2_i1:791-1573(-)